jgi:hypothetical protein
MGWTTIKNYQYRPNAPLVNADTGVPMRDGIDLVLALYNRTGGGTGSPNQVTQETVPAAGNSLDTATMLTQDWNDVSPVATGTGVSIPQAMLVPGADITVLNSGANTLNIHPPSSDVQIDALGAGSPYQLASGASRTFRCWSPTQLRSAAS